MHQQQYVFAGFVGGMARSGTTWLARSLSTSTDIAVFGESKFWGKGFVAPDAGASYTPTALDQFRTTLKKVSWIESTESEQGCLKNINRGDVGTVIDAAFRAAGPMPGCRELYLNLVEEVAKQERKKYILEKTPHYSLYIERIMEQFPEAKFVLLVRDPFEFVVSFKAQQDKEGPQKAAEARAKKHSAVNALVWRTYRKAVDRALAKHPKHVIVVDLKDISERPQQVLSRVLSFLGIDDSNCLPASTDTNTSFTNKRKPCPTPEDVFWVKATCRSQLRTHGYVVPAAEPLGLLGFAKSTTKLGSSLLHIVKAWGKRKKGRHLMRWLTMAFTK